MKTVNSWDELLDMGVESIIKDEKFPEDIAFGKDLILKIRVCGESWDGFIDYRGAQFILDLQNAVNKVYNELGYSKINPMELKKLITIKVKVVDGSSIFQIKLEEIIKIMVANMSGNQVALIAVLLILCAAGYFTYSKVLEYKHKALLKTQDADLTKTIADLTTDLTKTMADTFNRALDIIDKKDLQAPPRKLINKLDNEDRIQLPGMESLRQDDAKKIYPKKPAVRDDSGYFDGSYVISAINMEKTPVQFKLDLDGFDFWAKAQLDDNDIEMISRSLEASMKENKELKIDLHLFVLFNERGFKSAVIQATGPARENVKDLKEKIALWQGK